MTDQLQLRHWQQIKQAQALEYAGTPEGSAALVESRRYGLDADRIDELIAESGHDQRNAAASQRESAMLLDKCEGLAAQVEVMRGAIGEAMGWNWLSDVESIPESVSKQIADALTTPNTAAAILRQRDARVLKAALEACRNDPCGNCTITLCGLINELEKSDAPL